ncbi:MAG: hypothetical protein H6594_10185 [Flavobacteriales bacterium]|nr:hypothetical protein [Flavobacteriales bacterium]
MRRLLRPLAIPVITLLLIYLALRIVPAHKQVSPLAEEPYMEFAHRGGQRVFPENSEEGIAHALAAGFRAVEVDIHCTRDGRFVLFHDDSCRRMLHLPGTIQEHDLADLHDAPLYLNHAPTACRVVTLDTILARYSDRLFLYLDMKLDDLSAADQVAALIGALRTPGHVLVASSSVAFLCWMELRHPEIHTVMEGFDSGKEWTYFLFPARLRPDLVSSFASYTDDDQIAWLRDHDLLDRKIVYGVDSTQLVRLRTAGINRFLVDP